MRPFGSISFFPWIRDRHFDMDLPLSQILHNIIPTSSVPRPSSLLPQISTQTSRVSSLSLAHLLPPPSSSLPRSTPSGSSASNSSSLTPSLLHLSTLEKRTYACSPARCGRITQCVFHRTHVGTHFNIAPRSRPSKLLSLRRRCVTNQPHPFQNFGEAISVVHRLQQFTILTSVHSASDKRYLEEVSTAPPCPAPASDRDYPWFVSTA